MVSKVYSSGYRKKVKKAHTSWVIEYNGAHYLNLGYSGDLNNWKVFIKLNLEGKKYCASFIGPDAAAIIQNSGTNYGGGLAGVALKESPKWGKVWLNEKEEKIRILFIDLFNVSPPSGSRNSGSVCNLLSKKQLKKLFNLEESLEEIKAMSFGEVLSIIKQNNS